jgi:hypothetical protein
MKKTLIALTAFITLTACKKTVSKPVVVEPEVTKTAVWTITPNADYNQSYYNNASAEIKLAIARQLQNPYREEVIWDTTFQRRPMSQYIQLNSYVVTKSLTGIKDSQDKITVGYSISYITGPLNAHQYSAYGAVAERGNSIHKVSIKI